MIVVAGAGIGGLAAALALARDGAEVEVLEQAPALGAIGAGVTLAPNAMRVFRHLGLEDAIVAAGVEPARQRVQHWRDGLALLTLERGRRMRVLYGAPYVYVHRADLHELLMGALAETGRARVRLSAAVVGAEARAGGAAALLAGGGRVEGEAVIGADGVRSAIRRGFEPGAPHFTGHVAWRAVVPADGALRELAEFPGVHIGPGRTVVRYPVRQGRMLNLVFFARQDGWAEEGWAIPGRLSELRELFGGWAPEVGRMIDAIDERALFKWGVFARRPLARWVRDGRIALLGDAAHAMTPFLGQGAGTAVEDAMVLARCLRMGPDVPRGLARYEAARKQRCDFIQEESNANADRIQGDESELYGMTKLRNEETLGLFAYDAATAAV